MKNMSLKKDLETRSPCCILIPIKLEAGRVSCALIERRAVNVSRVGSTIGKRISRLLA